MKLRIEREKVSEQGEAWWAWWLLGAGFGEANPSVASDGENTTEGKEKRCERIPLRYGIHQIVKESWWQSGRVLILRFLIQGGRMRGKKILMRGELSGIFLGEWLKNIL